MKKQKYKINNDYFKKIDTPDKAYILGFMYADGCVYEKWSKIDLQIGDIKILEMMKSFMGNECPIRIYQDKKTWFYNENKERVYYPKQDTCRMDIYSPQISNDLIACGCIKRKTYDLTFPNEDILPVDLQRHFIRGYLDGDGSISFSERKRVGEGSYEHFNMTFTGTYEIVSAIKKILNKNVCSFVGDIRSRKNNNVNNFTLNICGNDILLKICEWLYDDTNFYLERKFEKYVKLKEVLNERNSRPLYKNRNKKFGLYKNGVLIDVYGSVYALEKDSVNKYGVYLNRVSARSYLENKCKKETYKGFKLKYIA